MQAIAQAMRRTQNIRTDNMNDYEIVRTRLFASRLNDKDAMETER